jgi:hypothetical protein
MTLLTCRADRRGLPPLGGRNATRLLLGVRSAAKGLNTSQPDLVVRPTIDGVPGLMLRNAGSLLVLS